MKEMAKSAGQGLSVGTVSWKSTDLRKPDSLLTSLTLASCKYYWWFSTMMCW